MAQAFKYTCVHADANGSKEDAPSSSSSDSPFIYSRLLSVSGLISEGTPFRPSMSVSVCEFVRRHGPLRQNRHFNSGIATFICKFPVYISGLAAVRSIRIGGGGECKSRFWYRVGALSDSAFDSTSIWLNDDILKYFWVLVWILFLHLSNIKMI